MLLHVFKQLSISYSSGEVKLVIDPDAHQQQFLSYMEECNDMMEEIR